MLCRDTHDICDKSLETCSNCNEAPTSECQLQCHSNRWWLRSSQIVSESIRMSTETVNEKLLQCVAFIGYMWLGEFRREGVATKKSPLKFRNGMHACACAVYTVQPILNDRFIRHKHVGSQRGDLCSQGQLNWYVEPSVGTVFKLVCSRQATSHDWSLQRGFTVIGSCYLYLPKDMYWNIIMNCFCCVGLLFLNGPQQRLFKPVNHWFLQRTNI